MRGGRVVVMWWCCAPGVTRLHRAGHTVGEEDCGAVDLTRVKSHESSCQPHFINKGKVAAADPPRGAANGLYERGGAPEEALLVGVEHRD